MPNRSISKINLPLTGAFSAPMATAEIADVAPQVIPSIGQPTSLSLSTANEQSAVTPSSLIGASWLPPAGVAPTGYTTQVATDSGFTNIVDGFGVPGLSAVFHGLAVATLYYVRVAAIAAGVVGEWSATQSITTASDTTAPSVPTSTGAAFAGIGDLVVTWTNSTSANTRDTEIKLWSDSGKTTLYATLYDATGRRVWTAAENLAATSGVGDPTVYVELRTRGYNNLFSSAVVVGTATKSAPAAPTVTHSWSGDTGAAGADLTLNWTAQTDAAYYTLNINSVGARRVYATTYTYTIDRNIAENTTADPTLAYSVTAVDGLNQSSTATAATATNAAPATVSITAAASALQNTLLLTLGTSAAADFDSYSLRIIKDGSTQRTDVVRTPAPLIDVGSLGYGSYTVGVKVVDVFGQLSTETISSAVLVDPFTLSYLRRGTVYTDNLGTSSTTLDALKDANTSSGGQAYT